MPNSPLDPLLADLQRLAHQQGLAAALRALFRQQVEAGFVLFDPADSALLAEKRFASQNHQPALRLQWNPQRELRLNPALLIARGVIAADVEPSRLIHRDHSGRGCYLCRHNIALQAPAEVVYPIELNGEPHILGSNFAPITNNHFTVIVEQHRPQQYHAGILRAGFELAVATGGEFRVLFNGRAGASILEHEHLHATDTQLPIEALQAEANNLLYQRPGLRIAQPPYCLPVWLVEGEQMDAVVAAGDRLIRAWQRLDPEHHSENLLMSFESGHYRLFIGPRDLRRLTATGRVAAMGSFEVAGLVVLSHASEQALYEGADAAQTRQLLAALTPLQPPAMAIAQIELDF